MTVDVTKPNTPARISPVSERSITLAGATGTALEVARAGKVGDFCRIINHPSDLPESVPEVAELLDAAGEVTWWEPNGLPVELQTSEYEELDLLPAYGSSMWPHVDARAARHKALNQQGGPDILFYLSEYALRTLPVNAETASSQLSILAEAVDRGYFRVRLLPYVIRPIRLTPGFRYVILPNRAIVVVVPAATTTTLVSGATHKRPYQAALTELDRIAMDESESIDKLHYLAMD
jgi:hypothetical protein